MFESFKRGTCVRSGSCCTVVVVEETLRPGEREKWEMGGRGDVSSLLCAGGVRENMY